MVQEASGGSAIPLPARRMQDYRRFTALGAPATVCHVLRLHCSSVAPGAGLRLHAGPA